MEKSWENTSVGVSFLDFYEHLFYRKPPGGSFCKLRKSVYVFMNKNSVACLLELGKIVFSIGEFILLYVF